MKKHFTLKKMALLLAVVLFSMNSFAADEYAVSGATGITNGTTYSTLGAVFNAINGASATITTNDDIVVTINAITATDETGSASLNAGNWKSLKIYPTVAGVTIKGAISGALINLNGADKVTIDGRVNLTGAKDLIINNTLATPATAAQAIKLIADASDNVIKYCTIKGASIAATNGTVLISTGTATGNDNNLIDNCDIADGATMPACGIWFEGSAAYTNDANTVSNCNIYNVSSTTAMSVYGINVNANTNTTTINTNKVYWTTTIAPAVAVIYNGIRTTGRSTVISNNVIGYASSTGTGTTTITPSVASATAFKGIEVTGDALALYATNITGNTIAGIDFSSNGALTTSNTYGIAVAIYANTGMVNIGTSSTDFNTIKDIKLITTANANIPYYSLNGIVGYGSNTFSIKYNKIYNLKHEPNTASFPANTRGIQLGSPTGANRAATIVLVGNEIHDLTAGIPTSTGTTQTYGIQCNMTGGQMMDKNLIYNLKAMSTDISYTGTIYGINTSNSEASAGSFIYKNNIIVLGNDITTYGPTIYGITEGAHIVTTNTVRYYYYHNSVYIGGTTPGTANTRVSVAFYKSATSALAGVTTIKNNIFVNKRTGGLGNHYLMKLPAATEYTSSYATIDNNLYQMVSGTNNKFGVVNTTDVPDFNTTATTSWKQLNAALDPNGLEGDPKFVDATNATTPNLHIQSGSAAVAAVTASNDLSGTVGDDFDGETRGGGASKQDIGADDISNATVAVSIWKKTPPANGTYAYNQNMDFTVEYTKPVTVAAGTPFIPMTLADNSVKNASYVSGSGTKTLTFRYTPTAAVVSTGVTVGDINLNGATIMNGSDNAPTATAQTLALVNIDATYGTSVTAVALPVVTGNTAGTSAASPIIFWTGAVLDYQVTFGEAVTVTGTPRIPITLTGGATVYATCISGTGTNTLTFRYTVGAGDATGAITTGTAIDLNGGTIKQGLGMNSFLTLNNVTPAGKFLSIDFGGNPPVAGTAPASGKECRWLVATAPANGTYGIGQNIDINVTPISTTTANNTSATALVNFAFTAGVNAPYIPITLDNGKVVKAYCTANSTVNYNGIKTFRYTIASGDEATNGITIGNIELNGSSMNWGSGANQVGQTIGLGTIAGVKVANYTLPTVSVPAATYGIGQTVKFTTTYPEVVNVTGVPSISLMVGTTTKAATYLSGSGSTAIVYGYTVASGDEDVDGITIASQDITLNGATIKNASSADVIPTIGAAISGAAKVANVDMPYITSVAYPAAGTYGLGANLDIYVTVNKAVTVTGTPYFPLDPMNSTWSNAYYQGSNADNTVLKFRYTVTAGVVNATGVRIGNLINLNGGTIQDAALNNMTLFKGSVESTLPTVLLDGTIAQPTVAITSPNATQEYALIPVTITFSKAVTGFDVTDLVLVNGSANNFTAVSSTVYTVDVTASAIGDVKVNVAAGVAMDAVNFGSNTVAPQLVVTCTNLLVSGLSNANNNAAIYSANQSIMINGLVGNTATIYSLDGQLVKSVLLTSDKVTVPSAKGFYIVKVGTQNIKLLVK